MGKISKFLINFNDGAVFTPGNCVTGTVRIDISGSVNFFSIKAEMFGRSQTRWWKKAGKNRKTYKASESYCRQELLLWGTDSTTGFHSLAGSVQKDFVFDLPTNCPSTFHGTLGNVVYSVVVTCRSTGFFRPKESKIEQFFTVLDPIDLSQDHSVTELCRPLELRGEYQHTSCCVTRSCEFDLVTEKRAYIPGERIVINGQISNDSPNRLPFYITLKRQCTFHGRRSGFSMTSRREMKTISRSEAVAMWQADPVLPRMQYVAVNMPSMQIPLNLSASGLRHCRVIDIHYTIEVTGRLSGIFGHKKFSLGEFPVVIGSRIHSEGATAPPLLNNNRSAFSDQPPAFHELEPSAPPEDLHFHAPPGSTGSAPPEDLHFHAPPGSTGSAPPAWHNEPPPSYDDVINEQQQHDDVTATTAAYHV